MIAAAALGGTAAYFLWHAFVPHLVRSSNLCS